MCPKIVLLDDDPARIHEMTRCLQQQLPTCQLAFFDNAPDMICWLKDHLEDAALICLDHDLGPNRKRDGDIFDPGTGRNVADYLATRVPICPILIHTSNSMAAPGMEMVLKDAGWVNFRSYPSDDLEWIQAYWINDVIDVLGRQ